jgi:hypothetical protein
MANRYAPEKASNNLMAFGFKSFPRRTKRTPMTTEAIKTI